MLRAYLLCGPSLAGKSTFSRRLAERLDVQVCSADAVNERRGVPFGGGDGLDEHIWAETLRMLLAEVSAHAAAGRSVVVDDTLCYRWLRDRWRQAAQAAGMSCRLLVLAPSRQEILFRFGATREVGSRPTLECKRLVRHLDAFEWPLPDEDAVDVTTLARQEAWLADEAEALGRNG